MIVVDTSALIAILFNEPDADTLARALILSDRAVIGAPTAFEFRLVVARKKGVGMLGRADALLAAPTVRIVAWQPAFVALADDALARFGGRPAKLNYGDCMAYALARSLDAPLLYKGDDFAQTDIRSALA